MDQSTHALYEQSLKDLLQLDSIKQFLTFLKNRFQNLEALGKVGSRTMKKIQPKSASSVTSSKEKECIVCKEMDALYFSKAFLSQSPKVRPQRD
ncbi:unnamed protein product [Hermetia illucens]|uniref:Uncharacterized protein n=1 Tax=Hermetia illucens TaxID=343691 RepID=A0A7R8UKZ3_HERIL|nr:unnamed protein product [Hermetia illucens]